MKSFEENIRKVTPYTPGEQPTNKVIKLNTNENPYPPSKLVIEALKNVDANRLKLYPDPKITKLVDKLADTYGTTSDRVFVGVGSDDVLAMAFLTFFNSDKPILFPDITYSFYPVWAELFKIPFEKKNLDDNFCIKKQDYFKDNGGVIIPNPNAPTGIEQSIADIEDIVKANSNSVVIIDEAYVDFGGESAIGLTEKYDNLLVVQTFSKSRSLAGMRIGFAIGSQTLIKYLNDAKYSFNSYTLSYPTIECGVAALVDKQYFKECCDNIIKTREKAKIKLTELGFEVLDSKANFLFAKHKKHKGSDIFEKLKEKGIYVRYWNQDRISDYLRITIGTDEEMESLYNGITNLKYEGR
ncbi:MAG: histidinol-phosphate transaminase [Suipraeoptans sp.]